MRKLTFTYMSKPPYLASHTYLKHKSWLFINVLKQNQITSLAQFLLTFEVNGTVEILLNFFELDCL